MLLDLTKHLQSAKTAFLFYKGEQVFNELEAVEQQLDFDIIEKNQRNYLYIKA